MKDPTELKLKYTDKWVKEKRVRSARFIVDNNELALEVCPFNNDKPILPGIDKDGTLEGIPIRVYYSKDVFFSMPDL